MVRLQIRESFAEAWSDISLGLKNHHVITVLGMQDILTRYRRSKVGAFWLTIGIATTIATLYIVFGTLFKQNISEFLPYLAIGVILWNFISSAILDGCNSFIVSSDTILQVKMPLFVHVMRVLWSNTIILAHNVVILPLVFLFLLKPLSFVALLAIPGMLIVMLNLSWIMLMLSVICARYRDFSMIVQNVTQVLYFFTPIMWSETLMPERAGILLRINPFYHLVSIVRAPLLGKLPSMLNWEYSLVVLVLGWILATYLFGRFYSKIAYWL